MLIFDRYSSHQSMSTFPLSWHFSCVYNTDFYWSVVKFMTCPSNLLWFRTYDWARYHHHLKSGEAFVSYLRKETSRYKFWPPLERRQHALVCNYSVWTNFWSEHVVKWPASMHLTVWPLRPGTESHIFQWCWFWDCFFIHYTLSIAGGWNLGSFKNTLNPWLRFWK